MNYIIIGLGKFTVEEILMINLCLTPKILIVWFYHRYSQLPVKSEFSQGIMATYFFSSTKNMYSYEIGAPKLYKRNRCNFQPARCLIHQARVPQDWGMNSKEQQRLRGGNITEGGSAPERDRRGRVSWLLKGSSLEQNHQVGTTWDKTMINQ